MNFPISIFLALHFLFWKFPSSFNLFYFFMFGSCSQTQSIYHLLHSFSVLIWVWTCSYCISPHFQALAVLSSWFMEFSLGMFHVVDLLWLLLSRCQLSNTPCLLNLAEWGLLVVACFKACCSLCHLGIPAQMLAFRLEVFSFPALSLPNSIPLSPHSHMQLGFLCFLFILWETLPN